MAGETTSAPFGAGAEADKAKRERSSIEFPYGDIDDALIVANAIHSNAGVSCSPDQLAAYMRQVATSGAFRLRVATARVFGLVETERGAISLTELGRRIVDQSQERGARVEAFFAVPLYRAIFDRYKGHLLPPPAALEREMANFGVSYKQTDKARQAFERSAQKAGFFEQGNDRLVVPSGMRAPETKPIEPTDRARGGGGAGSGGGVGGGGGSQIDPLIAALIQKLPPSGSEWEGVQRIAWLRMMAMAFDMTYGPVGPIEIGQA